MPPTPILNMLRTITYDFRLQPLISAPPPDAGDLYATACSGDKVTIDSWKDIWLKNYKASKDRFGSFKEYSFGKLHGINRHKPAIVIGSGPSLKNSIEALKENQAQPHPILTISCLHNLGYFEDEGIKPDYYLSLDSGEIVVSDVSEGRKKEAKEYWDATTDKTLIATVTSDPKLFELWKGKIYLFNTLIPDMGVRDQFNAIERFPHAISSGGNAGGACMYTAKAVMGSPTIMYVGIDMCFDYDAHTFHSYASPTYDKEGQSITWPDIFGVPRVTWRSYYNFAQWLSHIAMNVPGNWVSCSDGIVGAYKGGNLMHFEYLPLHFALEKYRVADRVTVCTKKVTGETSSEMIELSELFGNYEYPNDIVLF